VHESYTADDDVDLSKDQADLRNTLAIIDAALVSAISVIDARKYELVTLAAVGSVKQKDTLRPMLVERFNGELSDGRITERKRLFKALRQQADIEKLVAHDDKKKNHDGKKNIKKAAGAPNANGKGKTTGGKSV